MKAAAVPPRDAWLWYKGWAFVFRKFCHSVGITQTGIKEEVILSKTNFSSSLTRLYALLAGQVRGQVFFLKNHNLRMSMWASILRVMAMKQALG